MDKKKLIRNHRDAESVRFWEQVTRTAETVRSWPEWKRGVVARDSVSPPSADPPSGRTRTA